jgi:hypothetical protein
MSERQFDDLELREQPPRSEAERSTLHVSKVGCTQYTFGCTPPLTGGCCE